MLTLLASPDLPRTAALLAISAWLTMAVLNNFKDRGTNVLLLGTMMRMDLLIEEDTLGQGLVHRRMAGEAPAQTALTWVLRAQVLIVVLLWMAGVFSAADWLGLMDETLAVATINVAIGCFFALWTLFMCGGLYFGYWIKTPHVQQVHFTLFIIGLLLWELAN
ncbi:MAG: DUF2165 family protein [Thalassovita sp.]